MTAALVIFAACAISFVVGYVTEYRKVSRRWRELDRWGDYGARLTALAEIRKRAR